MRSSENFDRSDANKPPVGLQNINSRGTTPTDLVIPGNTGPVLSWYHHQPESHQQSFNNMLYGVREVGTKYIAVPYLFVIWVLR